jgi:hypothetical protein
LLSLFPATDNGNGNGNKQWQGMHGSDGADGSRQISLLRPHPIFGERKKEREIDKISFPM